VTPGGKPDRNPGHFVGGVTNTTFARTAQDRVDRTNLLVLKSSPEYDAESRSLGWRHPLGAGGWRRVCW
jgi:hypothetical protein